MFRYMYMYMYMYMYRYSYRYRFIWKQRLSKVKYELVYSTVNDTFVNL